VYKTLVEKLSCLFCSITLSEGKSREDRGLEKWVWIESDNSSWWDKSGNIWKQRVRKDTLSSTRGKLYLL